jgi:retron-type reverse transcriptase
LKPISIQSNIDKLFEKCLYFQLSSYINRSNLLSTSQFGFRPRHSPAHAIIKLTDYMFDALDKNEVCILVALDIRKAFDKVDREIVV